MVKFDLNFTISVPDAIIMKNKLDAIILAAGKGTRMKSELPKVLHTVCGVPMIYYAIKAVADLKSSGSICAVVGYKKELVKKYLAGEFGRRVSCAVQKNINGTAKAVEAGLAKLRSTHTLIMCADSAMIDTNLINDALKSHIRRKSDCTLVTKVVADASGLGRIVRSKKGLVDSIVEEIELTKDQKCINEINTGIYIVKTTILKKYIKLIKKNKKKKEYFFTDIIEILNEAGKKVSAYCLQDGVPYFSVNGIGDLFLTEKVVRQYLIEKLLSKGVRVMDPDTTYLGPKTFVGEGTVIYPFTFIENDVIIGARCAVGPFCKLRKGTVIKDTAEVGSFAEVVRSTLGSGTKMKHMSYMGDTVVGTDVNIGAGAVIANYDGKKKNKTVIADNAFIGSDSILVAPLKVGKGSVTGAGSVVTKNVKPGSTVVGVPARKIK